jgi:hypothetical protein
LSERTSQLDEGASAAEVEAPERSDLRYEEALAEVDRMRHELLRIRHIPEASARSEGGTRPPALPLSAAIGPRTAGPGEDPTSSPSPPPPFLGRPPSRATAPVGVEERPLVSGTDRHSSGSRAGDSFGPARVPAAVETGLTSGLSAWKRVGARGAGTVLPALFAAAAAFGVVTLMGPDPEPAARTEASSSAGAPIGPTASGGEEVLGGQTQPSAGSPAAPGDSGPQGGASRTESFTSVHGGYGLRYPSRWDLDTRGEVVVVTSPDGAEAVSFALGPRGLPVSYESFSALLRAAYADVAFVDQEATSVAGSPAIEVSGSARNRAGVRLRFEALLVERAGARSIGVFAARRAGGAPSPEALRIMRSLRLAPSP